MNKRNYIVGFVLSLALTVTAYLLCKIHLDSGHKTPSDAVIVWLFAGLALVQIIVQLVYFLHLNQKAVRWHRSVFLIFLFIITVLVAGTIWIMNNLNYNMMNDPHASPDYIQQDEGFHEH